MSTAYVKLPTGTIIETENPEHWTEGARMTAKAGEEALKSEALASLRETLRPGDTVYTVLRHVSRSGMKRRIDLYVFRNNTPLYLSAHAARVLGCRMSNRAGEEGVSVSGCGMDMGFDLVYNLGRVLFGKDYQPAAPLPDQARNDPGYALHHRWL